MSKFRWNCGICVEGRAIYLWRPFESLVDFTANISSNSQEDTMVCCQDCKSRVFKMLRGDEQCFDGCETMQKIKERIRKEYAL